MGHLLKTHLFEELYGTSTIPDQYLPGAATTPAPSAAASSETAATSHEAEHDDDDHEFTEEELNAALDRDFFRMDKDNDKHISLEEYKLWDNENEDYANDFAVLDRNHDGKLSRHELSGHEPDSKSDEEDYHEEDPHDGEEEVSD